MHPLCQLRRFRLFEADPSPALWAAPFSKGARFMWIASFVLRCLLLAAKPLFLDVVPLNLEEIFIYELGGAGDEVRDFII